MNLLNQVFIYAQHAPEPEQASFESPLKFASIINQLNKGGRDLITKNIINNDNNALNLFVLIFLLTKFKNFMSEYSILTKFNPIKPITKGKKKLIVSGKKNIKSKLKNELKRTIIILKENKTIPVYK
tara:strand:- start:81 stop:461 length:381 start_codon:yes stop_codon:yes gene_type:complete